MTPPNGNGEETGDNGPEEIDVLGASLAELGLSDTEAASLRDAVTRQFLSDIEEQIALDPAERTIAPGSVDAIVERLKTVYGATTPLSAPLVPFVTGAPRGIAEAIGEGAISFATAFGILMSAGSGVSVSANTWLRQRGHQKFQNELVTPTEATSALYREAITDDDWASILVRYGFDDGQREIKRSVGRPLLGIGEIITLLRRGYLKHSSAMPLMLKHGYTEFTAQQILTASEVLPSVQDTILQLVREVYNPDLRREFRLDEEYPEAATEKFARLGVSESSGKDFWASHWRLPSAGQGYRMLHRKKIPPEKLDELLKMLDYSPAWRELLTEIAYKTLTRVDIRRMAAVDVLKPDEVKERYEALGYSPADADLMTDFTEKFNAAPPEEETQETRNLTRAQVLRFFDNGVLLEPEAIAYLELLNYSPEDAASMVLLRQIKQGEDQLDDAIELVRRRFKNGAMPYNDAVSELAALDIPDTRKAIVLQKLEQERLGNIKLPTLAQLNKFLKKGIITDDIYEEELARLGYPPVWANAFMLLMLSTPEDEDPLDGTFE